MPIESILIIDDEPLMRKFLSETLKRKNYSVETAENAKTALSLLRMGSFDLVLTDLKMPDLSGIEVLKKTKEISPQILVIVMTAYGSVDNAVEAMKEGAFHYILKPFTPDSIELVIQKASEHLMLVHENIFLREEAATKRTPTKIIAESLIMKKILLDSVKIAKSQASVLIHGESGTGKEVIAAAIHAHSLRCSRSFIKVNCAAIPETLLESEFFGHEKGSFTGANNKRLGRFELADNGTLLLDEVTEIPIALQPKLLRAIQEQEFERVGGSKPVSVDIRIISTSNRNLKEAIEQRIFREDLYYRLNVVPISLPPLRERKKDILPLANYFLEKFCKENGKKEKIFDKSAVNKLLSYSWPGNIRELANIIERTVVLDYSENIESEHLLID